MTSGPHRDRCGLFEFEAPAFHLCLHPLRVDGEELAPLVVIRCPEFDLLHRDFTSPATSAGRLVPIEALVDRDQHGGFVESATELASSILSASCFGFSTTSASELSWWIT